ncbi:MAG: hypothetical protein AAF702_30515 [Chloroflexota bacterium]
MRHLVIPAFRYASIFYGVVAVTISLILLLTLITGCTNVQAEQGALDDNEISLPRLSEQLKATARIHRIVSHPNGDLYFKGFNGVSVLSGNTSPVDVSFPDLNPPYGPNLSDIAVNSRTGLVYALDQYGHAIHIINKTRVISTLQDVTEQPRHVLVDEDSNEVYVFYTSTLLPTNRFRAVVLSGTDIITEIILPFTPNATKYNAHDGHIYTAGRQNLPDDKHSNTLVVIDNHQIITTIQPLESNPQLSVLDMTINPENGDIYVLLSGKVVYWDRVNPPKSADFREAGYKNAACIMVDPTRELVYVCVWREDGYYVLVMTKEGLQTAIPVKKRPESIVRDGKHDYIYVGHYDPTRLSIIRETELITTLEVHGFGTSDIFFDEATDTIYTANVDDSSISIFRYPEEEEQSSWLNFLPFIGN